MTFTVIIPSYQRPLLLEGALTGLINQERKIEQIIIVCRHDDEATQQAANKFSSVTCLKVEKTRTTDMVNEGLKIATGDIIATSDDDAVATKDWSKRIIDTYNSDSRIQAVGGRDIVHIDGKIQEKGLGSEVGIITAYGKVVGNHHLGQGAARQVDFLKGVNMSFRKSFMEGAVFGEKLRGVGTMIHYELAFCLEIKKRGGWIIYDPNILVHHFPAQRFDYNMRRQFNELARRDIDFNLLFAVKTTTSTLTFVKTALYLIFSRLLKPGKNYFRQVKSSLHALIEALRSQ